MSGNVTFTGMERSKTIDLDLNTDSVHEPDEEFMVTLSVPVNGNATLHATDYEADGKILNDDKPTVSIALTGPDEQDEGNPGTKEAEPQHKTP